MIENQIVTCYFENKNKNEKRNKNKAQKRNQTKYAKTLNTIKIKIKKKTSTLIAHHKFAVCKQYAPVIQVIDLTSTTQKTLMRNIEV